MAGEEEQLHLSETSSNNNSSNMSGMPYGLAMSFPHMSGYETSDHHHTLLHAGHEWGVSAGITKNSKLSEESQSSIRVQMGATQQQQQQQQYSASRSFESDNTAAITDVDYNSSVDHMATRVIDGDEFSPRFINDRERIQLHNQLSWQEAAKQEILTVRCRETTAELYKSRLGSGSKGKCIKLNQTWMSPTEFETVAGRGSSKDWKRSIRFGGHTLQKLIEEGILAPHAISCTCSICCGDSTLTGPVRLFTPYKRKRRDGVDSNSLHSTSQDQPTLAVAQYNNSNPTNPSMNQMNLLHSPTFALDQIDEIISIVFNASQQLRLAWDQVKLQCDAIREAAVSQVRLQSEMEKRDALAQQRSDVVALLKRLFPPELETVLQQLMVQLQVETTGLAKTCSNCARDAFLECTACRRACYCSAFCQQKDWPHHQHQCGLTVSSNIGDQNLTTSTEIHDSVNGSTPVSQNGSHAKTAENK